MNEFGNALRAARESQGLSARQLAEMTRMTISRIEELEREDFSRIPAAIYGRGFVRLYCEAVGLDAKAYADEFTDIYNGNRDVEIRERVVPAPAESAPLPAETPAPDLRPGPTAMAPAADAPEPPAREEPALSRFGSIPPERPSRVPSPVIWRLGILGLVALSILALLAFGVRALYRATRPSAEDSTVPEKVESSVAPSPATPVPERTRQTIPALYID